MVIVDREETPEAGNPGGIVMPITTLVTSHLGISASAVVAAFAAGVVLSGRPGVELLPPQAAVAAPVGCPPAGQLAASLHSDGFTPQAAKNVAVLDRADCLVSLGLRR